MTTTFDDLRADLDELQAAYDTAIGDDTVDNDLIESLQTQLTAAEQALATAQANDATDAAAKAALQTTINGLNSTLATKQSQLTAALANDAADAASIAALQAENADLKEQLGTPPVITPSPTRTRLVGISGDAQKIPKACERRFDGGAGIGYVPSRRSQATEPRVHASWKILGDPRPSNAQLVAAFAHLLDHDKVEVEHEADVKYRKDAKSNAATALTTLNNRLATKNAFYDQVVALRTAGDIAMLDVVCTYSIWSFMDNGPKDYAKYVAKADVLGVDVDGDDVDLVGYTDYTKQAGAFARVVALAKDKFGGRLTFPEMGWINTKVGTRVAQFQKNIPFLMTFNPEECQIFDASGYAPLLNSSELTQLTALVNQYNS